MSLCNAKFKCLTISRRAEVNSKTFSSPLNGNIERADFQNISSDEQQCFLYVCGLQYSKNVDVRHGVLSGSERGPNITLLDVITEYHQIGNPKKDTALIREGLQTNPQFNDY
ncbi:unnamed protein product [Hymenolepis diminuta]|uniref:Uncharacterized protein n=1 Tax=Hymenolepis diminuta TaxID=6216 RepID=A0A564Z3E1_HYMDI|nr:unnamed protein product [Hymenolepis diminuta]